MEIFETKRLYERMLNLVTYLNIEHKRYPDKYFLRREVEHLAYPYYDEIIILLSNKHFFDKSYLNIMGFNDISSLMPDLSPIIDLCNTKIDYFNKLEEDRVLSNQEKIENMKYGKRGFWISIIAIFISILALLKETLIRIIQQ